LDGVLHLFYLFAGVYISQYILNVVHCMPFYCWIVSNCVQ